MGGLGSRLRENQPEVARLGHLRFCPETGHPARVAPFTSVIFQA
jgi:hypothetical protein